MKGQLAERCGSLEIGNDVLRHLMQAGLSGTEWSLVLAVIQQMKCGSQNPVVISLSEFRELVRLDQEAIRKGLKILRERKILVQNEPPSFTKPASWSFNEDFGSWVPSDSKRVLCQHTPTVQHTESPTPAQRRVLSQHTVSISTGGKATANTREKPQRGTVPAPATMINTNKHIVRLERDESSRSSPSPEALTLAGQLRAAVQIRDPRARAGRKEDLTSWARDIDLLMRIDQRSPDEIRQVIDWCQIPGGFWGPNILSGRKLREKFDTLSGQMMREATEAKYDSRNGNYRVPQILNNRAEREYVPVKEPVRI